MKTQQSGFTLIELVAVIVLLGILAVTAVPRFVDLQVDARISTLQGVRAAVLGADSQVLAKSLIQNQTGTAGTVTISGANVVVRNGHLASSELDNLITVDPGSFGGGGLWTSNAADLNGAGNTAATASQPAFFGYNQNCRLNFTISGNINNLPGVGFTTDGC